MLLVPHTVVNHLVVEYAEDLNFFLRTVAGIFVSYCSAKTFLQR